MSKLRIAAWFLSGINFSNGLSVVVNYYGEVCECKNKKCHGLFPISISETVQFVCEYTQCWNYTLNMIFLRDGRTPIQYYHFCNTWAVMYVQFIGVVCSEFPILFHSFSDKSCTFISWSSISLAIIVDIHVISM